MILESEEKSISDGSDWHMIVGGKNSSSVLNSIELFNWRTKEQVSHAIYFGLYLFIYSRATFQLNRLIIYSQNFNCNEHLFSKLQHCCLTSVNFITEDRMPQKHIFIWKYNVYKQRERSIIWGGKWKELALIKRVKLTH